jgi:hypothetical protein
MLSEGMRVGVEGRGAGRVYGMAVYGGVYARMMCEGFRQAAIARC